MNRDFSKEIDLYFLQKIQGGELINLSLRGEPGSGKSIAGLELFRKINQLLEEVFDKKIDLYDNIASDQTEFLRLAKRPKSRFTCIEIDEWNPMGKTGANATIEQAEFDFFSDLCRVYYIHRVFCAPIKITDPNATVIFDVMGKDKKNKRTHVKILYRNMLENQFVAIGSAWIDVSKTLEAEWHKKYEKKKLMRVDLLNTHGFRDVRELEFAEVATDIIRDLQKIVGEVENTRTLQGLIRMKCVNLMQTRYQRPLSWFAEDELVKPISTILSGMVEIESLKRKEQKTKSSKQITIEMLKEEIGYQFARLKLKRKILDEYRTIK